MPQGRVVQLPQLERMVHEALAAMRHFQARREPGQQLVWNRVLLTLGPPLELIPIRGAAASPSDSLPTQTAWDWRWC